MESLLVLQSNEFNLFNLKEKFTNQFIELILNSPIKEKQLLALGHLLKLKHTNSFSFYEKKLSKLTSKEQEVLDCICEGLVPKEIAVKLYIEVSTAKTHRRNIIKKLNIKSFKDWCIYSSINDLKEMI